MKETVVILGASPKPERYAHKAQAMLVARGHRVIPVHPVHGAVGGLPCVKTLGEIAGPVDTLTVYVGAAASAPLADAMVRLAPRRVIFNPGAENPALAERLRNEGLEVLEACTLVMLSTDQFERVGP